jgi:hypothetical protein
VTQWDAANGIEVAYGRGSLFGDSTFVSKSSSWVTSDVAFAKMAGPG